MRKVIKIATAGLMAALLTAGCGKTASTDGDYSKYVTLGQYKGIEITAVPDVTEEEVDTELAGRFRDTVEDGDTVNIDYEGTREGVAFEGGTAQGQSLTIGSNRFIDGFEEGLVGVKVGETVNLDLKFPDNYADNNPNESAKELAGQPVVFKVTINSIDGIVGPELTDEVIAANTSYATIAEYTDSVREELQLAKDNEKLAGIWTKVKENTVINGYPEDKVAKYADEMKAYYQTMSQYYGMDVNTLISAYGMTEETFKTQCETYGQEETAKYMILSEIARLESIQISDEEYKEELEKALKTANMTQEELLEYYGGEAVVKENLLYNKVLKFLLEESVEV